MAGSGVELLFGPMLIGVFLNTMLYGVFVVQTFVYFQSYKSDSPWIKCFVWYLLFCETLNTGFDIGMMYEPLIVRYGTPRAVTIAPVMLSADPIMTVMISSAVQLFIAWRVRIMSGSKFVPLVITFFAVTSFIGGIATTVSVTFINEYASLHKFDGAVITWLASSAAADVIITVSLVWSLYHQKTGFAATDDSINRLIRLTVQTGLVTAVSATLDVTLFLAVKGTTLNYVWDFALSKLYSNSLLSTLNARGGWKTGGSTRENVLFGPSADATATTTSTMVIPNGYGRKQNDVLSVGDLQPTSNYDLELHPQGRSYGSSATVSDEHREHAV
ncbi:hypothetical protein PAXINDRAFT_168957 [Paxillus involutus ATCC 200175]|uniref:Unplaced genomic scaffold PAXINscaffold_14, whole genome shotgun sequence n=1 Tax=Paxillus involutus ATCC 200175 TaxID=664439 RepID=A0A0C9SZ92_PAXIN|nr:hypothetical protein PAXINDRAFT_168957 [Paxillus involutus ATCC 200175]